MVELSTEQKKEARINISLKKFDLSLGLLDINDKTVIAYGHELVKMVEYKCLGKA